jgi:hypothetical protein
LRRPKLPRHSFLRCGERTHEQLVLLYYERTHEQLVLQYSERAHEQLVLLEGPFELCRPYKESAG